MEEYNLDFQGLCAQLDKKLLTKPCPLTGGLLHRMFKLETDGGIFAVKALNPEVMTRPEAPDNYRRAEAIARMAQKGGIPALPALQPNGSIFVQTGPQYWMIFPWAEGKALAGGEITPAHCETIGALLRRIHDLHPAAPGGAPGQMEINWADFLKQGKTMYEPWASSLEKMVPILTAQTAAVNAAAPLLCRKTVLSHRDLDPKNVLWQDGSPLLIDWEAVGPINPMQELLDSALYWSDGGTDTERFSAMLSGYCRIGKPGVTVCELRAAADGLPEGRLGWLRYNLARALGEFGTGEQKLGRKQVVLTLNELEELARRMPEIAARFIEALTAAV